MLIFFSSCHLFVVILNFHHTVYNKFTFNILFEINQNEWIIKMGGSEYILYQLASQCANFTLLYIIVKQNVIGLQKKPPPQNIQHKRWTIDFLGLSLHYIFIYFQKEKNKIWISIVTLWIIKKVTKSFDTMKIRNCWIDNHIKCVFHSRYIPLVGRLCEWDFTVDWSLYFCTENSYFLFIH